MEFQCRVIVQRRCTSCCSSVENIPLQAERHSARRQKLVRRPTGIGVHLQTGMLFGITTESCSASERIRVHLRADSPPRAICVRSSGISRAAPSSSIVVYYLASKSQHNRQLNSI